MCYSVFAGVVFTMFDICCCCCCCWHIRYLPVCLSQSWLLAFKCFSAYFASHVTAVRVIVIVFTCFFVASFCWYLCEQNNLRSYGWFFWFLKG